MILSDWTTLKYRNEWGHLYYHPVDDPRKIVVLEAGTVLDVKWRDGTVTTEEVVLEPYTKKIKSRGHQFFVEGTLPVILKQRKSYKEKVKLNAADAVKLHEEPYEEENVC